MLQYDLRKVAGKSWMRIEEDWYKWDAFKAFVQQWKIHNIQMYRRLECLPLHFWKSVKIKFKNI